jgi:signal transduction histidine kinase
MSPTIRTAAAVTGWGLSVLLLAAVGVVASVAPSELPEAADFGPGQLAVGLVAVSAQALLLLRMAASPRLGLLAVSVVAPIAAAAGLGAATGATSVAVLIAVCAVVLETPWRESVAAVLGAGILVAVGELVSGVRDEGWTSGAIGAAVLQGITTVGLAVVVGAAIRARRDTTQARAGRDLALAGEQTALAQAAVARERMAMARELHDIAAHHLSGIAVMTGALDRQIDTDPAGAKEAVRQVRQQSTAMLKDLRNLVALLRDPDLTHDTEPETLEGVPALVAAAREAGRDVTLTVLGVAPEDVPALAIGPLAQLAAYRTVQESLTNAARHAPGARCEVVIDARAATELVIVVHNSAPSTTQVPAGTGGGFGIVGMRERAELTDARLSAGPDPDGGWTVRLTVPFDAMDRLR